MNCHYS